MKFCSRPFEWFEVQDRGAYLCCPGWVTTGPIPMGDSSVREAWNSPRAQEFRRSILDGSFRFCKKQECPFLNQQNVPSWERGGAPLQDRASVRDPRLREIIASGRTELADGPFVFNGGYDRTCNLQCPSCRNSTLTVTSAEQADNLGFQERVFAEIGAGLKLLYLSGTGDPFASPVYRSLLRGLDEKAFPDLEIHLGTNGLLWTPQVWETMSQIHSRVTTAHISLDAAAAPTYAKLRVGGNWEQLMRNLEFISHLRREGPLRFVTLSFVVQQENFREMPAFIDLVKRFGFDLAYFHQYCDWGSAPYEVYRRRAVHRVFHPQHADFLRVLADPRLEDPRAGLCCVYKSYRRARLVRACGPAGYALVAAAGKLLSWRK